MRIALISDIHANLVSLEAVLADIERQQVDDIICLGDVATLGPQPHEVVARLQKLGCRYYIAGNHDDYVFNPEQLANNPEISPWVHKVVRWCANRLTPDDFDFLTSFQRMVQLPLPDGGNLLCCHASPRSNTDLVLATTPDAALDEMFAGYATTAVLAGHTHMQMVRMYKGTMYVNVGSVGWPLEQMPVRETPIFLPWAEYAIVSWSVDHLSVDLRRVSVDIAAIRQAARDHQMPDAEQWGSSWSSYSL